MAKSKKKEPVVYTDERIEAIVGIMRQYAEEAMIPPRSTSDLSPFEQWLLIRIYDERLAAKEAMEYMAANMKGALIEQKALQP